jgi:mannosyltransferase OCH1-like enzyme
MDNIAQLLLWLRRSLPKDVERADFFRYMVVLKLGGVYADADAECRRPMSDIIKPRDTMVVGWENEFATAEIAAHRNYARKRQVTVICRTCTCYVAWLDFGHLFVKHDFATAALLHTATTHANAKSGRLLEHAPN